MTEWRIRILDAADREIDAIDITAASWPAALHRAAQFFVTSNAMVSWQPAVEVRVRHCGDAA